MSNIVLQDLRQSIDYIDSAFMFALAERVRILIKIGLVKQHLQLSFSYSNARKEDLKKTFILAHELLMDEAFIERLFSTLYDYAQSMMSSIDWQHYMQNLVLLPDSTLDKLREHIFRIDQTLCYLLAERFALVKQVGNYKKQRGMSALVLSRWQEVLQKKLHLGEKLGVDAALITTIFEMVHEYALALESN